MLAEEQQPGTSAARAVDTNNGLFASFEQYMSAKVTKLNKQVNQNVEQRSSIFEGISFFVNGYTDPSALTLRKLIVQNGGAYHHYYFYGKTTYIVATALSKSKRWKSVRKNEKIIKPTWICECIRKGELMPEESFLIAVPDEGKGYAQEVTLKSKMPSVAEFYGRSRLHLISTLAQDMKKLVAQLRQGDHCYQLSSRLETFNSLRRTCEPSFTSPLICHIDLDCFFVSVALKERPDLVGKPVAITHSRGTHGKGFAEISSCSYEARNFNVRSGMLVNKAAELCPEIVCLPYAEFEEYRKMSKLFYSTVANYTLNIKAISCDELFVDLTNMCNELRIEDPLEVISKIRDEIFESLHCRASVGLGSNLLLARLATRKAKPDGQFWIRDYDVQEFMKSIKLKDLPGVGWSTFEKLQETFGDYTNHCGDLQSISEQRLQSLLGQSLGTKVFLSCRGLCAETFEATKDVLRKSVSCDVNFGVRMKTEDDLKNFLEDMAAQLASKLDSLSLSGNTLALKFMIRSPDAPFEPEKHGAHGPCNVETRSISFLQPVFLYQDILKNTLILKHQLAAHVPDIRGVGVQMTRLIQRVSIKSQSSITDFLNVRKIGNEKISLADKQSSIVLRKRFGNNGTLDSKKNRKENAEKKFGQLPVISIDFCDTNWLDLKSPLITSEDTIWIHSICIHCLQVPIRDTVQRLIRYFKNLVDQANFLSIKSSVSLMERHFLAKKGINQGWITVLTALKLMINDFGIQKYGARIL